MLAGWPGQLFEAVDYQIGWGVSASRIPVLGPEGGTLLSQCVLFIIMAEVTKGQAQDILVNIVKASAHITSTNTPLANASHIFKLKVKEGRYFAKQETNLPY